jgi:hypothetical protein
VLVAQLEKEIVNETNRGRDILTGRVSNRMRWSEIVVVANGI